MKKKNSKEEPMTYGERFVLTFIVMAITKNLPKINLILLKISDSVDLVIKECLSLKITGVAAMAGCTTTDTTVHNAGNLLQTMLNGTSLKPQLYTSNQVLGQKKIAIDLYNKVINFMKGACNDAAEAVGDVTAGITLANTCGGRLAKKITGTQPDFGVTQSGPGWVLIHAKKIRKGEEGHIFRVAVVSGKGVIPVKGSWLDCFSLEGTIEVSDLTSGTILAINHSAVLPVSRAKTPFVITPIKLKKATKAAVSAKHHPIFSFTSPDPYIWDGWIYVVVQ